MIELKRTPNSLTDYIEQRKYKREPCNVPIDFSLNTMEFHELKKISITGTAVDICKSGIGLLTGFPLETGHVLIFKNPKDLIPPNVGIVRWTASEGQYTKSGVQFCGFQQNY